MKFEEIFNCQMFNSGLLFVENMHKTIDKVLVPLK